MFDYILQIFNEDNSFWKDIKTSDDYVYLLNLLKNYSIFFPKSHFRIIRILDIR